MPVPTELDDLRLLEAFRDTRDDAAFTELVRRHLPLVFHVAYRRLGSAALAEEAAQHAFARLAAKVAAVARNPERLRAWLHRTAYFEASTLARKEARLSRLPLEPATAAMNRPEIYDRLDEALDKLPELDRELVLRHCCGGEDYRRMAKAVGKSEAACQKRVERALARLAQGMGGARTTAAVVAAFAVSTSKLPAAERVAAAALNQHAATGGVAGAISGAKVAACAALALAGGAAGWQRDPKPPAPPPAMAAASSEPRSSGAGAAAKLEAVSLPPRPVPIPRSLDEVLESILADRLAPLVEYLPQASVADLRAIMAEDDLGDLSEGMGSFGTAHDLAARRWVEIEPAAAFAYGLSRSTPLATRMLARWIATDAKAAADAFLSLDHFDRLRLAEEMARVNDDSASRLAAIDPAIAWAVEEQRLLYPDPSLKAEKAERRIAAALAAGRPDDSETPSLQQDFWLLAQQDREAALTRATALPWPDLRADTLSHLGRPLASDTLPPGDLRSRSIGHETAERVKTDPEGTLRLLEAAEPGADRDAMYGVLSDHLAARDPWQLLETVAALEGPLPSNDAVGRALRFAGKENPLRALALLPGISARFEASQGARGYAMQVISGWTEADAPAAIRWAAEAGIWLNSDDLARATTAPETLLELLSDPDGSVQAMARGALTPHLEAAVANGTAAPLLEKLPRDAADGMLKWIAADASGRGDYGEAMSIAALASPAMREKEILPRLGLRALRFDAGSALEWLRSLPLQDRRAVVEGVERLIGDPGYGGGDAPELRATLQQLTP